MNNPAARTIAIGDIHGCAAALRTILDDIQPAANDTIITLGDHIDRGGDSKGVIELLLDLRERCRLVPLMGNHEQMLVAAREGRDDLRYWLRHGGAATLRSYGAAFQLGDIPRSHLQFIQGCSLYHETSTHIFVHANIDAALGLAKQSSKRLLWDHIQIGELAPHFSGKTVIVGHTPQESGQILDLEFLKCIDTGCGFGGPLTALDVVTGAQWQACSRDDG